MCIIGKEEEEENKLRQQARHLANTITLTKILHFSNFILEEAFAPPTPPKIN